MVRFLSFLFVAIFFCMINPNVFSSSDDEEKARRIGIQKEHLAAYKTSSAYSAAVASGLGELRCEELPLPISGQVYVREKTGPVLKTDPTSALFPTLGEMSVYGPDAEGRVNTLFSGDHYKQESFSHTRVDVYKGSRKYPLAAYQYEHVTESGERIRFDRGHGIDHADGDAVSSSELRNYTPQNSYYNRNIRNPLVGNIRANKGSYREIAIYDPSYQVVINGKIYVPIGFVFLEFYGHVKKRTYYFPNLIDYATINTSSGTVLSGYRQFCDFFEIDDNGAFLNCVVEEGKIDEHLRGMRRHSMIAYQSLSGRFEVIADKMPGIPKAAKAALHKMLAVHHMERAGEMEFAGVEEKVEIVRTLTDKMKYIQLDRGTKEKKEARQKNAQAFEEALAKESLDFDEAMLFLIANPETLTPEAQAKHRKVSEILKQNKLKDEDEEGESLYDLAKAKSWLERIEIQVEKESRIEDKIALLELYQIPELQDDLKRQTLIQKLEEQGDVASTIDEKRQIANYFYYLGKTEKAGKWLTAMEAQLFSDGTIEEKLEAADWYSRGRGIIPCDTKKAKQLYEEVLASPYGENADERRRIEYILSSISTEEDLKTGED